MTYKKRSEVTEWENKYREKVNNKLKAKNKTVDNLTRLLGSYNYEKMRNFFNKGEGALNSRTIGQIDKILKSL